MHKLDIPSPTRSLQGSFGYFLEKATKYVILFTDICTTLALTDYCFFYICIPLWDSVATVTVVNTMKSLRLSRLLFYFSYNDTSCAESCLHLHVPWHWILSCQIISQQAQGWPLKQLMGHCHLPSWWKTSWLVSNSYCNWNLMTLVASHLLCVSFHSALTFQHAVIKLSQMWMP